MKKAALFLLVAWGAALPLRADLTIVQDIQQGGGPKAVDMNVTTKIKGHVMRMDINPQMSALHDLSTGETTSLVHPQKLAMKIPASLLKSMKAARQPKNATPDEDASLVDTGKKETINGFACEEYDTNVQGMKVRLWVTKDAPEAEKVMKEMKSLSDDLDPLAGALNKMDVPGFPVRTMIDMANGTTVTSTVVSLSAANLPAADFVVPADYKTMDAPMSSPPAQ